MTDDAVSFDHCFSGCRLLHCGSTALYNTVTFDPCFLDAIYYAMVMERIFLVIYTEDCLQPLSIKENKTFSSLGS